MNIIVFTDSRGIMKSSKKAVTWTKLLSKKLPQHKITIVNTKSSRPKQTYVIYGIADYLKTSTTKYDILVAQCGLHEWVRPLTSGIHKQIALDKYNPANLKTFNNGLYWYKDKKLVEESFKTIQQQCKTSILVGMSSWLFGAPRPECSNYDCHLSILEMNNLYGSLSDFYLNLPMNKWWSDNFTFDHSHFESRGHKYIANYLTRYINLHTSARDPLLFFTFKSLNVNKNSILSSQSEETSTLLSKVCALFGCKFSKQTTKATHVFSDEHSIELLRPKGGAKRIYIGMPPQTKQGFSLLYKPKNFNHPISFNPVYSPNNVGRLLPGISGIIVKNGKDVTSLDIGEIHIKSSYYKNRDDFYGYENTGIIGRFSDGDLVINA